MFSMQCSLILFSGPLKPLWKFHIRFPIFVLIKCTLKTDFKSPHLFSVKYIYYYLLNFFFFNYEDFKTFQKSFLESNTNLKINTILKLIKNINSKNLFKIKH